MQCLFKRATRGGLYRRRENQDNVRMAIRMAKSNSLLHPDKINEGFNAVALYVDAAGITVVMRSFLTYLRNTSRNEQHEIPNHVG